MRFTLIVVIKISDGLIVIVWRVPAPVKRSNPSVGGLSFQQLQRSVFTVSKQ